MAKGLISSATRAIIAGAATRLFVVVAPRAALTMTITGGGVGYQSSVLDLTSGIVVGAEVPTPPPVLEVMDVSGDLPKNGAYPRREMAVVGGRVWHHTASADGATWNTIAKGHVNGRGWHGIGYHIGIDRDGRIALLNPLDRVTNHTAGHNTHYVGCVLLGNYDVAPVGDRMEAGIEMVRRHLDGMGITREMLHRDTKATACPGRYAVEYLRKK